ncbi:molecular chaperone [Erwinia sp. ErVv1]|uniref:fimbrial biogenesis chaperone n=1 Tax=Erwinia sp. ErVv1 TaxID=1603299 RepID=UPI00082A3D66|nr:fimbria/pilus periplasmic chaperone [Erwinia sp. ErVv1]
MRTLYKLILLLTIIYIPSSWSVIQVMPTRVILSSDAKEETFVVRNTGGAPSLVQIWLSKIDYDGMDIRDDVPLFITPPVARINADKNKVFRLFQMSDASTNLPSDRESAFWINIFDVPATAEEDVNLNKLSIAFRTRIKAFYRPSTIKSTLIEGAKNMKWTVEEKGDRVVLTTMNNSPYHISFANISLYNGDESQAELPGEMVAPYSSKKFIFKNVKWQGDKKVKYNYISDLGAFITVVFKS